MGYGARVGRATAVADRLHRPRPRPGRRSVRILIARLRRPVPDGSRAGARPSRADRPAIRYPDRRHSGRLHPHALRTGHGRRGTARGQARAASRVPAAFDGIASAAVEAWRSARARRSSAGCATEAQIGRNRRDRRRADRPRASRCCASTRTRRAADRRAVPPLVSRHRARPRQPRDLGRLARRGRGSDRGRDGRDRAVPARRARRRRSAHARAHGPGDSRPERGPRRRSGARARPRGRGRGAREPPAAPCPSRDGSAPRRAHRARPAAASSGRLDARGARGRARAPQARGRAAARRDAESSCRDWRSSTISRAPPRASCRSPRRASGSRRCVCTSATRLRPSSSGTGASLTSKCSSCASVAPSCSACRSSPPRRSASTGETRIGGRRLGAVIGIANGWLRYLPHAIGPGAPARAPTLRGAAEPVRAGRVRGAARRRASSWRASSLRPERGRAIASATHSKSGSICVELEARERDADVGLRPSRSRPTPYFSSRCRRSFSASTPFTRMHMK